MQQIEKDTIYTIGEYFAPVCPMLSCLSLIPRCLKKFQLALLILSEMPDTSEPFQGIVTV